jgi:hypothetical protein
MQMNWKKESEDEKQDFPRNATQRSEKCSGKLFFKQNLQVIKRKHAHETKYFFQRPVPGSLDIKGGRRCNLFCFIKDGTFFLFFSLPNP